ncbi:unnamed protein product, partial [Prorocentrum cordatum]
MPGAGAAGLQVAPPPASQPVANGAPAQGAAGVWPPPPALASNGVVRRVAPLSPASGSSSTALPVTVAPPVVYRLAGQASVRLLPPSPSGVAPTPGGAGTPLPTVATPLLGSARVLVAPPRPVALAPAGQAAAPAAPAGSAAAASPGTAPFAPAGQASAPAGPADPLATAWHSATGAGPSVALARAVTPPSVAPAAVPGTARLRAAPATARGAVPSTPPAQVATPASSSTSAPSTPAGQAARPAAAPGAPWGAAAAAAYPTCLKGAGGAAGVVARPRPLSQVQEDGEDPDDLEQPWFSHAVNNLWPYLARFVEDSLVTGLEMRPQLQLENVAHSVRPMMEELIRSPLPLPLRTEWLNDVLGIFWKLLAFMVNKLIQGPVVDLIKQKLPPFMQSLKFEPCELGSASPKITSIEVAKKSLSGGWVDFKVDAEYKGDANIQLVFKGIRIGVKEISASASFYISFYGLLDRPPFFEGLSIYLCKPMDFNIKWPGLTSLLDIDFFDDIIKGVVNQLLAKQLVLPNRIAVPITASEDTVFGMVRPRPAGVLKICVREARGLVGVEDNLTSYVTGDVSSLTCDPFVQITVGNKTFRTSTVEKSKNPEWEEGVEVFWFLVDVPSEQLIDLRVFDDGFWQKVLRRLKAEENTKNEVAREEGLSLNDLLGLPAEDPLADEIHTVVNVKLKSWWPGKGKAPREEDVKHLFEKGTHPNQHAQAFLDKAHKVVHDVGQKAAAHQREREQKLKDRGLNAAAQLCLLVHWRPLGDGVQDEQVPRRAKDAEDRHMLLVDRLWKEFDLDQSGFLAKNEVEVFARLLGFKGDDEQLREEFLQDVGDTVGMTRQSFEAKMRGLTNDYMESLLALLQPHVKQVRTAPSSLKLAGRSRVQLEERLDTKRRSATQRLDLDDEAEDLLSPDERGWPTHVLRVGVDACEQLPYEQGSQDQFFVTVDCWPLVDEHGNDKMDSAEGVTRFCTKYRTPRNYVMAGLAASADENEALARKVGKLMEQNVPMETIAQVLEIDPRRMGRLLGMAMMEKSAFRDVFFREAFVYFLRDPSKATVDLELWRCPKKGNKRSAFSMGNRVLNVGQLLFRQNMCEKFDRLSVDGCKARLTVHLQLWPIQALGPRPSLLAPGANQPFQCLVT